MKITIPIAALCLLLITNISIPPQKNRQVIQFNIDKVLNARPVTTFTNNKLTPWTKGIDGGGQGDGYFTLTAALFIRIQPRMLCPMIHCLLQMSRTLQ